MAQQPPPAPAGPPADYYMSPPVSAPLPPAAAGYAMPVEQAPYQMPPQYAAPGAVGAGVGLGLLSQFSGAALTSCAIGVITVIVPFALGYVFYVLPIAGVLSGLRAIQRGKVIGGAAGIALNVLGGLITLIALKH